MRIRRCDCCGKDIEPLTGKRLRLRKCYIEATFEEVAGKEWHYDLCDRCTKFIEDTIKVGVKPEWLKEG